MKAQSLRQPRIPNIYEIYASKKKRDQHNKKLSQIRLSKRKNIVPNVQAHATMNLTIRQSRNSTFMNRFFQQKDHIAKGNIKIYNKLSQVSGMKSSKPIMRQDIIGNKTFHQNAREQLFRKQKLQNQAMFKRIRSSSSSIDNKKFAKDFNQSRRIKQRIQRYNENNELKSQKCYSVALKIRQSALTTLNKSVQMNQVDKNQSFSHRRSIKSSNIARFYNKDQIVKNKLQNRKKFNLSFTARNDIRKGSIDNVQTVRNSENHVKPYLMKGRRYSKQLKELKSVKDAKDTLFPTETIG